MLPFIFIFGISFSYFNFSMIIGHQNSMISVKKLDSIAVTAVQDSGVGISVSAQFPFSSYDSMPS
jgi:hypothetical protein